MFWNLGVALHLPKHGSCTLESLQIVFSPRIISLNRKCTVTDPAPSCGFSVWPLSGIGKLGYSFGSLESQRSAVVVWFIIFCSSQNSHGQPYPPHPQLPRFPTRCNHVARGYYVMLVFEPIYCPLQLAISVATFLPSAIHYTSSIPPLS